MKFFSWIIVLALSTTLWACGSGQDNNGSENKEDVSAPKGPEGYVQMELSSQGYPLKIWIPDTIQKGTGSQLMTNIGVNDYGQLVVMVGNKHRVSFFEGGDLELKKTDLQEDLVFEATLIQETPQGFVYKQELPGDDLEESESEEATQEGEGSGVKPQYHFYAVINIDGIDYEVEDINEGTPFSQQDIEMMFKAVLKTEGIKKAG